MAGYCTTGLEVEQMLALSSDVYCVYSRVIIIYSQTKEYRISTLFRFTDQYELFVRKQASDRQL